MKKILLGIVFVLFLSQTKAQEKAPINPFESVIIEMVCDCNPSQVLNTFVTDANGAVNLTVPKDANYSFKLVMPLVLKAKGLKVAALANDVVVNFKGPKKYRKFNFQQQRDCICKKFTTRKL